MIDGQLEKKQYIDNHLKYLSLLALQIKYLQLAGIFHNVIILLQPKYATVKEIETDNLFSKKKIVSFSTQNIRKHQLGKKLMFIHLCVQYTNTEQKQKRGA